MTRRWIRTKPGVRETAGAALAAGFVATAVGSVTFYLARLFLSREAMGRDALAAEVPEPGKDGGT